jgi:hypothetical protein
MFEFKIILQHQCKHINNALVNINNYDGLFISYYHLLLNPTLLHPIECTQFESFESKTMSHHTMSIQKVHHLAP